MALCLEALIKGGSIRWRPPRLAGVKPKIKVLGGDLSGSDALSTGIKSIWKMQNYYVQPLNFAYKRLLNKPYENEVPLTKQNPPSKCCQTLELLT